MKVAGKLDLRPGDVLTEVSLFLVSLIATLLVIVGALGLMHTLWGKPPH